MNDIATIISDPRILFPLLIWAITWKGIALWKSARNNQIRWYVVLLVLNTVGTLEIIYILWFQKKRPAKSKK